MNVDTFSIETLHKPVFSLAWNWLENPGIIRLIHHFNYPVTREHDQDMFPIFKIPTPPNTLNREFSSLPVDAERDYFSP